MSHTIPFGRQWEATSRATTGAATASVAGHVLSCSSVVGESAKATRFLYLQPGESCRLTWRMRRVAGADATAGGVKLVVGGVDADRVRATSTRWKAYSIEFQNKDTAAEAVFIAFEFGVFTDDAGTVEYARPTLEILAAQQGALRTVACGLITINGSGNGTVAINTGFSSHGIRALAYDSATKRLTITMDRSSGAVHSSPLCFVGMDNTGNAVKLIPRAGNYSAVAGTVAIQFYDVTPANGQTTPQGIVDIATYGAMYMWFKAEI